jgi:Tripartite tricarboxylate transporter family receptor
MGLRCFCSVSRSRSGGIGTGLLRAWAPRGRWLRAPRPRDGRRERTPGPRRLGTFPWLTNDARALATTSRTRAEPLPDVPTVAESGYTGYAVPV